MQRKETSPYAWYNSMQLRQVDSKKNPEPAGDADPGETGAPRGKRPRDSTQRASPRSVSPTIFTAPAHAGLQKPIPFGRAQKRTLNSCFEPFQVKDLALGT